MKTCYLLEYTDVTRRLSNRDSEVRNLVRLHKYLGSPPVFARFDNGLCYGFAKGRSLELHEMSELTMARRIAKEKARMLSDEDIKKPLLYNVFFSKWIDEIPEALDTEENSKVCLLNVHVCVCVCMCSVYVCAIYVYTYIIMYMCMHACVCLSVYLMLYVYVACRKHGI